VGGHRATGASRQGLGGTGHRPGGVPWRFATARSTGSFSGSELGFSFKGRGDTDGTFAELGSERNGSFLT